MSSRRIVATMCVVLCLLVSGADGRSVQARSTVRAHSRTLHVTIVTDKRTTGQYKPRVITVRLGDRIVFRNASNAPHTVSADKGSFDSGTIFVRKSWTLRPKKAGTFTYFCQFHAGMRGKIVVTRP